MAALPTQDRAIAKLAAPWGAAAASNLADRRVVEKNLQKEGLEKVEAEATASHDVSVTELRVAEAALAELLALLAEEEAAEGEACTAPVEPPSVQQ